VTAGNDAPGTEDPLGALHLTLARGLRRPAVYAFGAAAPAAAFRGGAAAAEVLDVSVHTHQRYSHSVYVLAAALESLDLPPLRAPYEGAELDRDVFERLERRLRAHPALKYASDGPGLEFVEAGGGSRAGLYDRRPALEPRSPAPWIWAAGDRVAVVFLDSYGAASKLARGATNLFAATMGGADDGKTPAPRRPTASAWDAPRDPQHYIARFTVAAVRASTARAPLACCCAGIDTLVRLDAATEADMAAMRFYRGSLSNASQARARAAETPTAAAARTARACEGAACVDYALDVAFLRLPTDRAGVELWRNRQGDCAYTANCG